MSEVLATLVVVPRERFSPALASLDQIRAVTPTPHRLVVVDAGSPPPIRRGLEVRSREQGFRLVREDRFLSPNQARNRALPHLDTRYTVFLDNDVRVTPGWLERLIACAEETGAGICGPLQLIGPLDREEIHLAGGISRIEERDGRRTLVDAQILPGARVSEVRDRLVREPVDHVEFHCLLIRTELLRALAPLDEELLCLHEYTDLCLQARERGEQVFLEPEAVVTYLPPQRLPWSDLRYFALRWSDAWTTRTLERFRQKWRLDAERGGLGPAYGFARWRRRFVWAPLQPLSRRLESPVGRVLKDRLLRPPAELATRWLVNRTRARHGDG